MNTTKMHDQNFFTSDESTATMVFAWVASVGTYLLKILNVGNIQSGLVIMTSILAVVFTILKIRGQRLENESKRLDIELKRKKLDDDENN